MREVLIASEWSCAVADLLQDMNDEAPFAWRLQGDDWDDVDTVLPPPDGEEDVAPEATVSASELQAQALSDLQCVFCASLVMTWFNAGRACCRLTAPT